MEITGKLAGVKVGDRVLHYWHDLGRPTKVIEVSGLGTFRVEERHECWYDQDGVYCNRQGRPLLKSANWAGRVGVWSAQEEAHYWLHVMRMRLARASERAGYSQLLRMAAIMGLNDESFVEAVKTYDTLTHEIRVAT